ncbi:MAG: YeeE/YedE family protein [Candidatus Desulfofervidaceae bacterium]|nr:YeeE/YedE family protein [Candidatus Desulfofervidaceae bacterium]
MLPVIYSLCLGFLLGYLGQRARLCFIGGMRDYVLVRDSYLLKGLFSFFLGALVGFILFHYVLPCATLKTFPWFANGAGVFLKKWKGMGIQATPSPVLPVPGDPITWSPKVVYHLLLALIGGTMVGFFSVLAGGCPFRQHIMAAEGSRSTLSYILGFAVGAVIFHKLLVPVIKVVLK